MSYTITVSGHHPADTLEAGREAEAKTIEAARELVAKLEGVHTAHGSFQFHGGVNLLPEAAPAVQA